MFFQKKISTIPNYSNFSITISDAKHGKMESVSSAQTTTTLTIMESAVKLNLNAKFSIEKEVSVWPAIKVG